MPSPIFETQELYIEVEPSEIPWLKIFTKHPYKELSDLPKAVRLEIFDLLDTIEKEMIAFFQPDKINIASFGNYMPRVHLHIMARFKEDSYFPEPMWGKKQREASVQIDTMDLFYKKIVDTLCIRSKKETL